ncbi:hypothetical protein [Nonlabens xiamenensis]|uniref:hypothetical protein n=1 Tax=Nonlabens xiamenensis TaxID=2341043 RepID=UPI001F0CB3F4|nr:hypothetical protein [Nonlabens xiamenensis]
MKKILRFIGKSTLYLAGFLLLAGIIIKIIFTEDIPEGQTGPAANELAFKMLESINYKEFANANEIRWTFRDKNTYHWKVQEKLVNVYWDDYRVAFATPYPEISHAFKNDQKLSGEERENAIAYAEKNFNNDSFWIVAPFQVMDIGTKRSVVKEDGKEQLLVQYTSGGTTPGDTYLWELDKDYQPIAFKMWVDIIPLDGVRAKWQEWEMTAGGFPLSRKRTIYGLEIPISDLEVIK